MEATALVLGQRNTEQIPDELSQKKKTHAKMTVNTAVKAFLCTRMVTFPQTWPIRHQIRHKTVVVLTTASVMSKNHLQNAENEICDTLVCPEG